MAKVGYIFCNSLCLFRSFMIFVFNSWCSDLINHDIIHHLLIIMLPYSKGYLTDNQRTDQAQHIISDLLKPAFATLARLVEINVTLKKMTHNALLVFSMMTVWSSALSEPKTRGTHLNPKVITARPVPPNLPETGCNHLCASVFVIFSFSSCQKKKRKTSCRNFKRQVQNWHLASASLH